jgi:hypothetical protein
MRRRRPFARDQKTEIEKQISVSVAPALVESPKKSEPDTISDICFLTSVFWRPERR